MPGRTAARALATLAALVLALGWATPAYAGGTWLYPVQDRYEAGDSVTLVGYVGRGTMGWLDDGPFYGYLHRAGASQDPPYAGVPLGPLKVQPTGATDWTALRVSLKLTLDVTADLEPGQYTVAYCNDPCTKGLGDLVGSRPFAVDVAPTERLVYEWPLDEPEIANLAATALVGGPGYVATAAEVRAGRVRPGPVPPMPPANQLGAAASPATTVAAAALAPAPAVEVAAPAATALAPAQAPVPGPASPGHDSPGFVVVGVLLAVVGTGAVLSGLGEGAGRPGAGAYATRRRRGPGLAGLRSTSSPTTHAPWPSVSSS